MPTIIIFNDDSKEARRRLRVDEEPAEVAAALEKNPLPKLTASGDPVWVNASSIRTLEARAKGAGGGAAGAAGKGTGAKLSREERQEKRARRAERQAGKAAAAAGNKGSTGNAATGEKPKS